MLEQIGDKEVYVRDYTSNFNIKEYIQDYLIPVAFPNIPINKLNLGLPGIVSDLIAQGIEDSFTTASLMMNEAFITKAILPRSIYASGAKFGIGGSYAVPSKCNFALEININDIVEFATKVPNTNIYRYIVDKDTTIYLDSKYSYRLDYDIYIDYQITNGEKIFSIYYNIDSNNNIGNVTNRYLNYRVTSIGWLVILVNLQEFMRKYVNFEITDNSVTTASDLSFSWSDQIAGFDLFYTAPNGKRTQMIKKVLDTGAEFEPFAWYRFINDQTIQLSFSSNPNYFSPEFNSSIEVIVYTTNGAAANFTAYNNKEALPVDKISDTYEYNGSTRMVALCYGSSVGGQNRESVEQLRSRIITAYQTAFAVTTENDLKRWYALNVNRSKVYSTEFQRKRDDPSGRLYSQFTALMNDDEEIFPTNTLNIQVESSEFDQILNDSNEINSEFIIEAGHLWEYIDNETTTTVKMIKRSDGKPALISDKSLPSLSGHVFVNPFFIKIRKDSNYLSQYNCLLNETSFPEEININSNSIYQFQLATMQINRSLANKGKYTIRVTCAPAVEDELSNYIQSISINSNEENINEVLDIDVTGTEDSDSIEIISSSTEVNEVHSVAINNLRVILVFKSSAYGETGYIEMEPISINTSGSIIFEASFYLKSKIELDGTVEIDPELTEGVVSLIVNGEKASKIFIDSEETSFEFVTLMKTEDSQIPVFDNPQYTYYQLTNKFINTYRNLTLFKPMSMMRSNVEFSGENNNYSISATLIPFIKYTLALNEDQMLYFISAFNSHYDEIAPIHNFFDGDMFLDLKLFNSYGRSNNYYIGPPDDSDNLYDSDTKLDSVYVKVKFKMAVFDRSIYSATEIAVKKEIKKFFEALTKYVSSQSIHVSNLIRMIENNIANVRYIRFLGFNDYDARKQSIFIKENNSSIVDYVPEILCIDDDGIEISEEI